MQGIQPLCAPGAVVRGDVEFGENCSVWYNAVVRADSAEIRVGAGTNIQDGCVLHVDEGFPLRLGEGVTVGHGAILHGCTVGDNTLVGMGATVLNGAVIGRDSIVAAGALVPQGHTYPDGMLLLGVPARAVRALSAEEIAQNRQNAAHYVAAAAEELAGGTAQK